MAYTPDYTGADIASVVIDFIVAYAIQITAFVALIALVGIFVWFKGSMKK